MTQLLTMQHHFSMPLILVCVFSTIHPKFEDFLLENKLGVPQLLPLGAQGLNSYFGYLIKFEKCSNALE